MTKTKKTIIALLTVVMVVCMGLFTFTACKKTPAVLDSIKITKRPTTTTYVVGETFKEDGIEVTATYKKGNDKTEKVLDRKNYELTVEKKFVDNSGKFQLAEGETRASVRITVSYTEKEVTKTANTSVTLTKPVKSIKLSDGVEYKGEYFAGQFFDASDLKIDVTYLDDTTEEGVEIILTGDEANATIKPAGAIPSGTEEMVLTYGGKDLKLPITLLAGVWIEGETGLLNGEYPRQWSTSVTQNNQSGNLGLDAALANAQEGALNMFIAQAKADYALEQLKLNPEFDADALAAQPSKLYENANWAGVEVNGKQVTALYDAIVDWLNDSNNRTYMINYTNSTAFNTLVNEYLESEQYQIDVNQYRANADIYLGGVSQNNVVSFVFSSDGEGTGSIAFRLASAYICLDNGNWTPKIMGDIQLNKLADVYINGIKYNVPDSAVLYGGMTPDGSNLQQLWVNWQEVELSNVAFLEGRNVIELKIKQHGITAPAQTSYNWSCNVDSMYLKPAEDAGCTLGTYDNSTAIKIDATTATATLTELNDKITLTVAGTYTASANGYTADQLNVKVGDLTTDVIAGENGAFAAIFDVTDLDIAEYKITVEEKAINIVVADTALDSGYNTLTLVNKDEEVILVVSSDAKIASVKATGVKLEKAEEGNDVYLVITGTVDYTLYTDEEVADFLNAYLNNEGNGIDFQGPLASGTNKTAYGETERTVEVTGITASTAEGATAKDKTATFTFKVNLNDKITATGNYAIHFNNGANLDFITQANKDAEKPETLTKEYMDLFDLTAVEGLGTAVASGRISYTLAYEPWYSSSAKWGDSLTSNDRRAHFYGCVGVVVGTVEVPFEAEVTATSLAVAEGAETLVVTGTCTSGADELEAKLLLGTIKASEIEWTGTAFTAKFDLTGLAVGEYSLTLNGKAVAFTAGEEVPGQYSKYQFAAKSAEDETVVLKVTNEYKATLKSATIFDANAVLDLVLEDGKVIYKITGTYEADIEKFDMENEADKAAAYALLATQLKAYFTNFRFENNPNVSSFSGWGAIASLTDTHVATVVDGTHFTLSCDVTSLEIGRVVMNKMAAATNPNSNGDYKPKGSVPGGKKVVDLDGKTYTMYIDTADSWSLPVVKVTETVVEVPVDYAYKAEVNKEYTPAVDPITLKWGDTEGANRLVTSGANIKEDGQGFGSFTTKDYYAIYIFNLDKASTVDFIWTVAGAHWDGSGNGGVDDISKYIKISIDGKVVDTRGIAANGGSSWWETINLVITGVELEEGEHFFTVEIIVDGYGFNVGDMKIYVDDGTAGTEPPVEEVTIDEAFVGTWTGSVASDPDDTITVECTATSIKIGEDECEFTVEEGGSITLTLDDKTYTLVLNESEDGDTLTLTLQGESEESTKTYTLEKQTETVPEPEEPETEGNQD